MQSRAILFPRQLRFFFTFYWSGLRARMTLSYVAVTLGSVLSFVLLAGLGRGALSALFSDSSTSNFLPVMQRQAQSYALVAALQAQGTALDPQSNFLPGHSHTLALPDQEDLFYPVSAPYISTASTNPTSLAVALLIAANGHLVTSSYPARYSAAMPVSTLLPEQREAIDRALAGQAFTGTKHLSSAILGYTAVPVLSKNHQPIGVIYLQAPEPQDESIVSSLGNALFGNILLLLLVIPFGFFFGRMTTRNIVRRIQQLVQVTKQFADGDYSQRVGSRHHDEIGQLEQQYDQMAEQLVENIAMQKQLADQNARLEERSRISRELHDAISQDLFSMRMLIDGLQEGARNGSSSAVLRPHITLLEQTTGNVIREMRALLLELRPVQLENLGLAKALQQLAQAYSTRLGITVTTDVRAVVLDIKTEHALLRIAQEALAHAARHSHASIITLCLMNDENSAKMSISDNGKGFTIDAGAEGYGLGLQLMRERIEELHGTFDLKTALDQGTCITVFVPMEVEND